MQNIDLDGLIKLLKGLTNRSRKQCEISKNPLIASGELTSIKNKNELYGQYLKKYPKLICKYKKCRNKLTYIKETMLF